MAYRFTFSTIARTVQVRLLRGEDIAHLPELDRKYWLMLSCAVSAMGAEGEAVAKALDSDGDGRVRVPEVLAAIEWLRPRLRSFDVLFRETPGLELDDIRSDTEEGKALIALFKRLCSEKTLESGAIDKAFSEFRASSANGDGVIAPADAGDQNVEVGKAILAVTGGVPATDGTPGISADVLDAFVEKLRAYRDWQDALPKEALPGAENPVALAQQVLALKAKVEDFFRACQLLRYNPALAEKMTAPDATADFAHAPLALPSAQAKGVPFEQGVNPTDAKQMACLATFARNLDPSAECLTETLWGRVLGAVEPWTSWLGKKPAEADYFSALDAEALKAAQAQETIQAFRDAIAADLAQAPLAGAFDDLCRLLTLRGGLLRFLRNFVNVEALYPPHAHAWFQTGTLYMDGRACTLCFPIEQAPATHATAALPSKCCLAYCTLTRKGESGSRTICAVFTAGSAASLATGRNGIFFDLAGKDWEATLVHLTPNPMSLVEAFFSPWRKIGEAFAGAIRKFVSGKNTTATSAMVSKAEGVTTLQAPSATPQPAGGGMAMASVATLGIALSFVATAVTGILAALTNTPVWKTALAVLAIILAVSIPSMILTWFRLRARDLAPILNASGWAVNRRIGLTASLGRFFTQRALYIGKKFVPAPVRSPVCKVVRGIILLIILAILAIAGWWFFSPCSPRNKVCEKEKVVECASASNERATKASVVEAPAQDAPATEKKE